MKAGKPEGWPSESARALIEAADLLNARAEQVRVMLGGKMPKFETKIVIKNSEGRAGNPRGLYLDAHNFPVKTTTVKGKLASLAIRADGGIARSVDDAKLIIKERARLGELKKEIEELEDYKVVDK